MSRAGKGGTSRTPASSKLDKGDGKKKSTTERLAELETQLIRVTSLASDLQSKVIVLENKLVEKDKQLIDVINDLRAIKTSTQFMSDVADEVEKMKTDVSGQVNNVSSKVTSLQWKTNDLEDRSRRDNLIFWNIPEPEEGILESSDDCEKKIIDELIECYPANGCMDKVSFERVHRLGPKKKNKTRAIIAKLSYHKDKCYILDNSRSLKRSKIGMTISEDFCPSTLALRKELWTAAKAAQNAYIDATFKITHVKLVYQRAVISYFNKASQKYFTKSFSISDIKSSNDWYVIKQ